MVLYRSLSDIKMINTKNKKAVRDEVARRIKQKKSLFADAGNNSFFVHNSSDPKEEAVKYDKESFLQIAKDPQYRGFTFLIEDSHFTPRTRLSKSQPLTKKEIDKFLSDAKTNDMFIRTISQKCAPNASTHSKLEKKDENDPISLEQWINSRPNIALNLKNPENKKNDLALQEGYTRRKDHNEIMNIARWADYDPELDDNTRFIKENIEHIASQLSDEAKMVFRLTDESRAKRGSRQFKFTSGNVKFKQMHTILSTLRGEVQYNCETDEVSIAGKLRYKQIVNEDGTKICSGELPKWKAVSTYDIPLCSFHHRGGLGSSNIRFWGFRPFVWEQSKLRGIDLKGTRRGAFNEDQEALFKELRKTYFNSCRELFNVFREMLLNPSIIFNQDTLNEQQDLL